MHFKGVPDTINARHQVRKIVGPTRKYAMKKLLFIPMFFSPYCKASEQPKFKKVKKRRRSTALKAFQRRVLPLQQNNRIALSQDEVEKMGYISLLLCSVGETIFKPEELTKIDLSNSGLKRVPLGIDGVTRLSSLFVTSNSFTEVPLMVRPTHGPNTFFNNDLGESLERNDSALRSFTL